MDYFKLAATDDQIRAMSSLGLAYLGDGVFEVMVRSWLCLHGKATSGNLHKAALRYVAAPKQAEASAKILPLLTEAEHDVFRRGRNASPHSVPKAASRDEYATATAVEALFGYLYLQGKTDRLNELFAAMMEPDEAEVT
ncbi:MAG: ribonuclease III domain-containing protein [Oscillospiraceae bacterium]